MILTNKKALSILFILVVLVKMNFLYLGVNVNSVFLPALILFTFSYYCAFCKKSVRIIRNKMVFANQYCMFSLSVFVLVFLFTLVRFSDQPFSATLSIALPYFSLLLFYPITSIFIYDKCTDKLFNALNIIAFAWYLIIIIQSVVFITSGRVFLVGYFTQWASTRNNGLIRINLFEIGNLMILYNFFQLYNEKTRNKNKLFNLLMLLMGLYSLIFIQQTRMYYFAIFFSLFVIVLYSGKDEHNKYIRNVIIAVTGILVVASSGVIPNILSSFSLEGQDAYSTRNRLFELHYYWNYFLDHPLLGMGFAHSSFYPTIVRSVTRMAATSDVGIIGQLVKLGVFAIPIYLCLCYRMAIIVKRLKKGGFEYVWILTLTVYTLMTSFTLIIFDQDRYLLYPLLLSVFEYEYYSVNSTGKEDNSINEYSGAVEPPGAQ